MKKNRYIIAFIAFMLGNGMLNAQSQYYYRTGDTIVGRSPIYFYQWWTENWLADTNHKIIGHFGPGEAYTYNSGVPAFFINPYGEVLQYCYTNTPLKIIGIATSCAPFDSQNENPSWQEYLRLYDATERDFILKKEVQYSYNTPVRYMELVYKCPSYSDMNINMQEINCCDNPPPTQYYLRPIREYYFDKPVTVYDSFYVGYTTESFCIDFHPELPTPNWNRILGWTIGWDSHLADCSNPCGNTPIQLHKYRHLRKDMDTLSSTYGDTIDKNWHWMLSPFFMLEFPIVAIDSSYIIPPYECPPIESPRIANIGDDWVILLWNTHPDQNSWQISYGPQGTDPDEGIIVDCPIQVRRLDGLDTCTHYTAYIRAVCDHDSICYSQWSEPIDIYICDTAGNGGDSISITSALSQMTNIVPNPASTSVTVYSSFQLTGIEAYDLHGVKMLDIKASGVSATIDVATWPHGVYIVIVHTPVGNVAKKLVVSQKKQ